MRAASRRLLPFFAAAASMLLSGTARAERRSARLVYAPSVGPTETCPTEQAMRDRIAGRLGYDPFVPDAPRVVELTIRREQATLRGAVAIVDEGGHRGRERVYTESEGACAELATTMALTASLLIDPSAAMGGKTSPVNESAPTATPESREPPPEPTTPTEPAAAEKPPRATSSGGSVRGRIGGGVLGVIGTEPEPTLGFDVFGGAGTKRWTVDVEGRLDLPRDFEKNGLVARLSLLAATLAPCVHLGVAALCALGTGGALQGSVSQGAFSQSRSSAWFALGARAALELPLVADLGLRVHTDVQAALTRTNVDANVGGVATTLWESPPVAATVGAGLLYTIR